MMVHTLRSWLVAFLVASPLSAEESYPPVAIFAEMEVGTEEEVECSFALRKGYPAPFFQICDRFTEATIPLYDGRFYELPTSDYLRLQDGSIWEVQSTDFEKVSEWSGRDHLRVRQNFFGFFANDYDRLFSYVLYNLQTRNSCEVRLVVGGPMQNPNARYVTQINYEEQWLILNDGSFWSVCDQEQLRNTAVGHFIIIGQNDSLFTSYPNILINVHYINVFMRAR